MTSENNSIQRVKVNISSNKKASNLERSFGQLFKNKIKPYLTKKIDSIDSSIDLSIDKIQIDLSTLNVKDVDNLSVKEQDQLFLYFKEKFDFKINNLVLQSRISKNPIYKIQAALQKGFISSSIEENSSFDLAKQLENLSISETRSFYELLIKDKGRQTLIFRLIQQLSSLQIDSFFKKIDVKYPLIFDRLNEIFNANRSYFSFNKEHWEKLKYHYFLSNKSSDISNIEQVIKDFSSEKFSINFQDLETIKNSQKELSVSNSKLRDRYFKKEMSSYPKLLKELNNYYDKVEIKNAISKKELVYKFQNFLIENPNQLTNSSDEIIEQFIKSYEKLQPALNDILTFDQLGLKASDSLGFIPNKGNEFYEFLKTGSFSIQSNNISEKSALAMLLKFVRQKPFEIRKALLNNKVKALWYLISKFNDLDYELFIHQLSPNFLFEKKQFFKLLEKLAQTNSITISNFKQLSSDFNKKALQTLIIKKEIYFKTPKGMFIKWVENSKIAKGSSFKNQNWENLVNSESKKELIKALESTKQKSKTPNKEKPLSNEEGLSSDTDLLVSVDQQTATFFKNVLSHFLLFNEIPWWAKIQFNQKDLSSSRIISDLINQFKSQFNTQFVQFLELIKISPLLLDRLVYKTNISVFNFLLKDLIGGKNITQIKLFLEDISSISTALLGSNLYQNQLQKDIYFSIISNNKLSIDAFFDQIFKALISVKSVDLKNQFNRVTNLKLQSNYFTTFSIEDRLKLINNKNQQINDPLFKDLSMEKLLYKQLFKDIIYYFKTGVLKGILATNKSIYIELFNELSKDKNQREILFSALKESILPPTYFLLSNKELSEKSNQIDEIKKSDLQDRDSLKEQNIEQSNIQNDEKINIEVFEQSELAQLNIFEDEAIEPQLLYYKKSPELNIAIFKYFIFNMEMPWWSPFKDISEFQQQFIHSFSENSNIFFKEMASLFTKEDLSKNLFSFFDFKLNQSDGNLQLGKLVVNDLDQLIIKKWEIKENFPEIYAHFLALKLLLGTQVSIDKQIIVISEFLNYVISFMGWSSFKEIGKFIDSVNELLNSINQRFDLSISIKESIEAINKVEGNKANLTAQKTAENIATIDQKIYDQFIGLPTTQSNAKYEKVVSFLLAIKSLLPLSEYRFVQEIILGLEAPITIKEIYPEFENEFFNQILKLIHLLFIEPNNYSVQQLMDEMAKNSTELSNDNIWVEELQHKLKELGEFSEQPPEIPSSTIDELSLVLKEKFPQEAAVYLKAFTASLNIKPNIEVDLNATFIAFMYYLAIETQKEIRPLMLSFFRLKSITDTSVYPILMNINKEEVIENFEKTQPDLILNFELQFLINKLDLGGFVSQSADLIMEFFKSLDIQKWSSNYLLFIIQQFAQNKNISLINAFDSINERVGKETQFKHLKSLKILLSNFEEKEYFTLEDDTYSKTIKDTKSLSKISQKPENMVREMMRQVKFNDQFLEQYKKFYDSEELKNENLSFKSDEVLPQINKGEQLQIYNAGLALIWPFVGTLFTKLGYIKDKAFIDKSNQFRAVHLLQYIIDGGVSSPEFVLVFNKLICGIPLSDPLDMFVTLTKEEKHQGDQFLESIKVKWKEMKNTSLDTFRDSFLKREGTLTFDGKNWKLQVESKPIDVLLRKLPWGISLIKFHWIDYIIFVEWTTKN